MVTQSQVKDYYDAYIKCSRRDIKFTNAINYYLERFIFEGYTIDDLRLVITYLHRRIRDGIRQPECLKPMNLFGNPDNFAEELSVARAESRDFKQRIPEPKRSVLAATGRAVTKEEIPAKSADQIMRDSEALKKFREFSKTL